MIRSRSVLATAAFATIAVLASSGAASAHAVFDTGMITVKAETRAVKLDIGGDAFVSLNKVSNPGVQVRVISADAEAAVSMHINAPGENGCSAEDNVAIGAGRGVHFTIRALRELAEQRKPVLGQLDIYSMVGAMWVRTHSIRQPNREFVDADQNALELADIFGVPWPKVHLVWLPRLYMLGDEAQKEEVIARVAPHLLGDNWQEQTPKDQERLGLSLFGLGVVNDGGHFMMRHWGPQIEAVEEIEALRQTVLPLDPSAVVDVCDRFWLRRDAALPGDVRAEAQRIVDSLNRRSVAVSFVKLNAARRRCLVAGGAHKLEGLVEVLLHGEEIGIRPNVLVTDDRTAAALLERLPEP